jgi:radical SAM superfamily enzyme YgiQ (UPF0313 family)
VTTEKKTIFLCDLYHDYKDNHVTVPLNIGYIGQYILDQFGDQIEVRLFKSVEKLFTAIENGVSPFLIGFSNYSWNVNLNVFAQQFIREKLPDVAILEGGPHIRTDAEGIKTYLEQRSTIDFYAMFEGEFATGLLLEELFKFESPSILKISKSEIPGIAYLSGDEFIYSSRKIEKADIETIPSPYLSGLLDEFLKDVRFLPMIETNRGCPFACTFCVWGISVLNKVRKFPTDRVINEIKYISKNSKAGSWYFSDANFGMFPRDIDIAKAIQVEAKNHKFFSNIAVNWAKNSSKFTMEIAHILKGICEPLIAVQSTDQEVLKKVKRDNIKMETMTDLLDQGRNDDVPMTTDVLAGLPGESYLSHLETLRDVFRLGFESFNVGLIRLLPGSEMETVASRNKYKIQTKYRLIPGFTGIYRNQKVFEYEEAVVGSEAMTFDDMLNVRTVHFLSWALWNSGLAQPLLRHMQDVDDLNPLDSMMLLLGEHGEMEVQRLLDDYQKDSQLEWYDSVDELEKWFYKDKAKLEEPLKLNLKYLALILMNKDLARKLLQVIANGSSSAVAQEFVTFSLERIIFVDDMKNSKKLEFSADFYERITSVYPAVSGQGKICEFSISEKELSLIKKYMTVFDFEKNQLRGLSVVLQNFGTHMIYDFSFGGGIDKTDKIVFADSFDYSGQLETHS